MHTNKFPWGANWLVGLEPNKHQHRDLNKRQRAMKVSHSKQDKWQKWRKTLTSHTQSCSGVCMLRSGSNNACVVPVRRHEFEARTALCSTSFRHRSPPTTENNENSCPGPQTCESNDCSFNLSSYLQLDVSLHSQLQHHLRFMFVVITIVICL